MHQYVGHFLPFITVARVFDCIWNWWHWCGRRIIEFRINSPVCDDVLRMEKKLMLFLVVAHVFQAISVHIPWLDSSQRISFYFSVSDTRPCRQCTACDAYSPAHRSRPPYLQLKNNDEISDQHSWRARQRREVIPITVPSLSRFSLRNCPLSVRYRKNLSGPSSVCMWYWPSFGEPQSASIPPKKIYKSKTKKTHSIKSRKKNRAWHLTCDKRDMFRYNSQTTPSASGDYPYWVEYCACNGASICTNYAREITSKIINRGRSRWTGIPSEVAQSIECQTKPTQNVVFFSGRYKCIMTLARRGHIQTSKTRLSFAAAASAGPLCERI